MVCSWPRKLSFSAVLFIAAWMQFPSRADAWSAAGHRIVANIAYDRLDPVTRADIVKILRSHPDFTARFADRMPEGIRAGSPEDKERWIFLQASIWPDLIRSQPKYHKGTWHYIDIPFYLSNLDQATLENVIKPNVNMEVPEPLTDAARDQLNCVQAVKLALRTLKDAAATDEQKAISICWVMHIAGDSHQPLHSVGLISRGRFNTADGDKGGNGIRVQQGRNLHGFWDGLLGGEQGLTEIRKRTAEIVGTEEFKAAAEKAARQIAPEIWIQESYELAKTVVYHKVILDEVTARDGDANQPLQAVDLPLLYRKDAGHVAQRRVAEAGYRLAEIFRQAGEDSTGK
jgi:S1/P1 Nuclease